jgi:8-hydroxy-5-deazaflavin:NADPH oxidoreductase
MQIGIIGAGMIGGTVGRLWAEAGHKVRFATRHPDKLENLVKDIGENASIGTIKDAARFGEVIFVAVPFGAWPALASEIGSEIEGKVVADAGNLYPARDGKMAEDAIKAGGSGTFLKTLLPKARVVRAFNSVYYKTLASEAHRSGERLGMMIAGDDEAAVEVVAGLVSDAGFDPVMVGPLRDANRFDVGTRVYNKAMTAAELREALDLAEATPH